MLAVLVAVALYAGADLARVELAVTDGEHPKGTQFRCPYITLPTMSW